jgi:N utilization substance protein A
VTSSDKRIDPVGACVGMKGIRIQAVSKELNNEKIDVIPWNAEPEIFITRAMSPAKPVRVLMDEPNKRAIAVLPDEQISLAIGRGGQNRRLTGKLTGYEVEIIKESEYRKMIEEQRGKDVPIELVEGLSEAMVSKLQAAGLKTLKDALEQGEDGLLQIKGIGEKTAKRIWALIQERETGPSGAKAAKPAELDGEEKSSVETETSSPDGQDEVEPAPEKQAGAEAVKPAELEEAASSEETAQEEQQVLEKQPAAPGEAETSNELASVSEDNQKGEN